MCYFDITIYKSHYESQAPNLHQGPGTVVYHTIGTHQTPALFLPSLTCSFTVEDLLKAHLSAAELQAVNATQLPFHIVGHEAIFDKTASPEKPGKYVHHCESSQY